MELPPLSPGIQARVMEDVEVVETVRRGWSGGTGCRDTDSDSTTQKKLYKSNTCKSPVSQTNILLIITLHHEIDYDGVKAKGVSGRTGVVPRILCFD